MAAKIATPQAQMSNSLANFILNENQNYLMQSGTEPQQSHNFTSMENNERQIAMMNS